MAPVSNDGLDLEQNNSNDVDQSVMDDSLYIEGSEPDVAATLAGASAARSAATMGPSDVGGTTANMTMATTTTREPHVQPDVIEQTESSEKMASRRNLCILVAIVLLGAAIIGVVLGLTLTGTTGSSSSNDNNSESAQGPSATVFVAPTPVPLEQNPTPLMAPVTPVTASPVTPEPTTPAPITFSPVTPEPTTPAPSTQAPIFGPIGIPFSVDTFAPTTSSIPSTLRPTSTVQALLETVALQGGAEFDDPLSYQSQSLEWLEGNANIGSYSDETTIQRYVCGCIHFSTSGVFHPYMDPSETEWMISDGWLTDDDECTWHGITCDLASASRITGIDLRANNVTGSFAPETKLLANSLLLLDIGNNNVWNRGTEVDFLGELTNLQILDIGTTYFDYDGIPPAIGQLTNLVQLDIAYTLFFGPIRGPEVFANLKNLRELQMGGNAYEQSIPMEIAQLPLLERFYCDNALLVGNIDFIIDMPVIFEFWVDNNPGLVGTLPTAIGDKFQTLQSFSVTNCGFTGTIPSEMGNLLQMQLLWFFGNDLAGSVPESLGNLKNLLVFDISNTMLTGSIPDGICALTSGTFFEYVCSDCDEVECCCCSCCTSSTCIV